MDIIGNYEIVNYSIFIDDVPYNRRKVNYYNNEGELENTLEYYGEESEIEAGYEFISDDNLEMIEYYRKKYSTMISNISGMKEAIERFIMDETPIPETIISERERLKTEFHTITDQFNISEV